MQFLRDLKTFFGVTFKIQTDAETKTVIMTCVGTSYINVNKKIT